MKQEEKIRLKTFLQKWCDPYKVRQLWDEERLTELKIELNKELDQIFKEE